MAWGASTTSRAALSTGRPQTGAHEVHGAIRGLWAQLGWERSFLGYPLTNETATPDGTGRFNHFQGGSIYWTPATGAHEVHGAIRGLWAQLGWERSFLGYPTTDETTTPDGVGRFNHFQGGSIYWTPSDRRARGARRDPRALGAAGLGAQLPRLPAHQRDHHARRRGALQPLPGRLHLLDPADRRARGARRHPRPLVTAGLGTQLPRLPDLERARRRRMGRAASASSSTA